MNALQEQLFLELRQSKTEIEKALKEKNKTDWMTNILREELVDISRAIEKLYNGNFGACEISGELIPEQFLKIVPTMRSFHDSKKLNSFYRKPI